MIARSTTTPRSLLTVAMAVCVSASLAADPPDPWAEQLTDDSYEHWREYLLPDESEVAWREIDWRGEFWQGVVDAQIEGKPILLWAMNGHPMGCV